MGADLPTQTIEAPKTPEQTRDGLLNDIDTIAKKKQYPLPKDLAAIVKTCGTIEQQIKYLQDLKDQITLIHYFFDRPDIFIGTQPFQKWVKMQPGEAAPLLRLLKEREDYIDELELKGVFGGVGEVKINGKILPWDNETINLLRSLPPQQAIKDLKEIKLTLDINNKKNRE